MKIAIVNDMKIAVTALQKALSHSDHEVVWIAINGEEAVEKCQIITPDLVLMDLLMPVMDGVEATRQIMEKSPCPILVVTSSVEENADKVFRAMGAGALDAINTPLIEEANNVAGSSALLEKIRIISLLSKTPDTIKSNINTAEESRVDLNKTANLVVIGASSGGPQALKTILEKLPENFPVPIVVIQHVDENFAPELAAWLNTLSPLNVRIAKDNESLKKGNVYIAGKNDHLTVNSLLRTKYTSLPDDLAYKPSVNVFFNSIANNWKGKAIGILLTGMGNDGAEGLLRMKQRGDYTITQDQESSAVYGMPKAAINMNAARAIIPLDNIAQHITQLTSND